MKKLLYFFLCLFTIFMLVGCDSIFGDDDDDDDTIDIGDLNLTIAGEYSYDSDESEKNFDYSDENDNYLLDLYFYYATDPSLSAPESKTFTVTNEADDAGEVKVYFSDVDSDRAYEATSGSLTVSNNGMTVTLSDVKCLEYEYESEELTGDTVKLKGSITVTEYE